MSIILLPLIIILLITLGFQATKNNSHKPLVRLPRKVSVYILMSYFIVIVLATFVLYLIPLNENSEFQSIDQAEVNRFTSSFVSLYEGKFEDVDSKYLMKEWVQEVRNDEFYLKPKTLGQMPVLITIERIPGDSNRIEAFLYEGKLIMNGYEAKDFNKHNKIDPSENGLTISSTGTRSYDLAYFEYDMFTTQFTKNDSDSHRNSTSEWSSRLHLKIPESINVTIDESIAHQVNER
ncbi:hypothetical protein [Paenisporosarcina quisquiliarum]|uniref:hypothetical protein n=1 Tax=Paenisporosarcina quisquiliarum TaxID=365346 RepID=UPI003735C052